MRRNAYISTEHEKHRLKRRCSSFLKDLFESMQTCMYTCMHTYIHTCSMRIHIYIHGAQISERRCTSLHRMICFTRHTLRHVYMHIYTCATRTEIYIHGTLFQNEGAQAFIKGFVSLGRLISVMMHVRTCIHTYDPSIASISNIFMYHAHVCEKRM